jgi:NAD(P)-dependent dehydrogenase (short-subunit alcohol dehydrogenase family)
MNRLQQKTALITGGNAGIGYATAKEFITEGAAVIITGHSKESLQQAATELNTKAYQTDHSSLDEIRRLAEILKKDNAKLDILFLNAGITKFSPLESASESHYDDMMNLNVKGTYFTAQSLLPLIKEGGSIIFNASVNAAIAAPGSSVYAASKAALLAISRVLAKELLGRNIRVNAISPGPVSTALYDKLGLNLEQKAGMEKQLSSRLIGHRFGKPSEIAKLVTFLASEEASFITGTEITIDGGLTLDPAS